MSKESTATAQVASAVKASPQYARLMVAETEETYISGEELYTEGSSDEDNNCSCTNSPAKDSSAKDPSATLARLARCRLRLAERPSSSGESQEAAASTKPSSRSADSLGASDEEEEEEDYLRDEDDVISWKVNREEEIMLENEMVAIENCRIEYPKICDNADLFFEQYFRQLVNLEQVDNEIFVEGKEKVKGDLINSVQFLDTTMDEIMCKVEQIKKKTKQIQLKNRLRLKEILKNTPAQSAKLAENTKKFFDLYTGKELSDTSESCRTENEKKIGKSCPIEHKD